MSSVSPRVSVVTGVYNEMPWLPMSIESVLGQTFVDFEYLLIDDGSKNGCPEVLGDYESRDPRVRVIRKPNGGQVSALNLGISQARGDYIARLDADDMMYPTRLEKQVAFLDAHPSVGLVGSQVDAAFPTGTTRWHTPADPHLARWVLLFETACMGGGVTMRTQLARALGGYDPASEYAEDYHLFQRMAARADVVNLPETLSWFNNLRTTNASALHAERQDDVGAAVAFEGMRRYLPDDDEAGLCDLVQLVRRSRLAIHGPEGSAEIRIGAAVRRLHRLHRAFMAEHAPPRASRRAIALDRREKRLARIRWALVRDGGLGALGRLHRNRWDSTGLFLQLPGLVRRR